MINFWIVSALLTVLACLFLLVPVIRLVFRGQPHADDSIKASREHENVSLFKERLVELEFEKSEDRISDSLYEQRKQELELALLNDVKEQGSNDIQENHSNKVLAYSMVGLSLIFVIVFSVWMYQENGSKALVDEYYAMGFNAKELNQAKELAKQGDMTALLNQLYDKLKAAPNNLEGWQLLSRSAMNSQRYVLAVEAYEQIVRIYQEQNMNPAPIYGLLAQAQYYQSEGQLTADVSQTIQEALALDENELNSIGLLAIDAFSNQQFLEAKNYWLKILATYPEHPARASIEAGIQRANAQLGLPEENLAGLQVPAASEAWVNVSVSIDESIKNMLEPSDTVFIIAKNVDQSAGSKAPLAVSRHTVGELPLSIKLDDSKAMAPIAKISMAQAVMVIARISKSGNPIAQTGDYEAVSADLSPINQESIELVIQDRLN